MDRLRKSLVIGGVVGVPLLGLAAGWTWWMPGLIRARASDALEGRFGVEASVGDADIGRNGVRLRDLSLRGRSGGLEIDVEEVMVEVSPWGLLTDGAAAVVGVEAAGVEVAMDLEHEGAGDSLAAIREGLGASSPGVDEAGQNSESRSGELRQDTSAERRYRIEGLDVSLRDERGDLATVRDGRLEMLGATLTSGAAEAHVGGEESDELALTEIDARFSRAEGHWQIAAFEVGGGTITLARRGLDARAPGEEGAEESADATLHRLRAVMSALRGRPGDSGQPAEESSASPFGDRLADEGRLGVESLEIIARTEGGDEVVLQGLRGEVKSEGGGRFHLTGAGRTDGDGSLRWDLHVEPTMLRGEGRVAFSELPLALVTPFMPRIPWYEPERARLEGELTVSAESPAELAFEGSVDLREAALLSERISPDPVFDVSLGAEGAGTWNPAERRLELSSAKLRMAGAEANVAGVLEMTPDHYVVNLRGTLPPTRCSTALGAIPPDLMGGLAGFGWRGRIGGRLILEVDSRELDETELSVRIANGCRFDSVPPMADLRRVQRPFRHEVLEPDGTIFSMTTGPGTANWTSIHAVSPFFLQSVISHEDGAFFRHTGFSVGAIRDALVRNLREGRYVVGASTITMQLAKNLFLHREKTLARKVQEVLLTWWLESALSKQDILELYVNVIEYGPAIYGVRNAAWHFFGRDPAQLSPAESAFLAAVLPNPKSYYTSYERGRLTNAMRNRMRRQLNHMHSRGRIDAEALAHGLAEIESFSFHADGQGAAPARPISGLAAPMPFATVDAAADSWEWEGSGEAPPMTAVGAPTVAP